MLKDNIGPQVSSAEGNRWEQLWEVAWSRGSRGRVSREYENGDGPLRGLDERERRSLSASFNIIYTL